MPDKLLIVATGTAAVLATTYLWGPWRSKQFGMLKGPRHPVNFTLLSKASLTHDTTLFTFALPDENEVLGLPIGNHIVLKADSTQRPYTPVSPHDIKGRFDLAVKVYRPDTEHPNGGKMSQLLDSLPVGAKIQGFGPFGMLQYQGSPGKFQIRKGPLSKKLTVQRLCLIAGGTGITPIFQLMQEMLIGGDPTKIELVFANKTTDDLILKNKLDELARKYPDQLSITYLITDQTEEEAKKSPVSGKLHFSKLDRNTIESLLPKPSDDYLVAVCGPPKMVKETCLPALKAIGFKSDHVHAF